MLLLILRELSSFAALACGNEGKSGKEDASGFNAGMAVESSIDSGEDAQLLAIEEDGILDWVLGDEEMIKGGSEELLEFKVWL